MNGQQLTNSSNSANGTPSSSYPASLSSQSSRDPSPATRAAGPPKLFPESYNHVISTQANHWPTEKTQLTNSFSSPINHSAPITNPPVPSAKPPPPTIDSQALPTPVAQPRPLSQPPVASQSHRTPLPSSHPLYKFPPPTSLPQPVAPAPLTNHLPPAQPTNLVNQYPAPVRTSDPSSNSTQPSTNPNNPAESTAQPSLPPTSTNQIQPSNQFQKPSSAPYQLPPKQSQSLTSAPVQGPQQPYYQFSSSQTPPLPNLLPPQNKPVTVPSQKSQQPNQYVQPQNQFSQQQNKFSQPQNQLSQPPNQFPPPQNQFPHQQKFSQPPNQFPQQQKFSHPPNQLSQPPNQFPQQQNQFSGPPQNNFPHSAQSQYPQPQNKLPQPENQLYQKSVAQPGQHPMAPNQYPRHLPPQAQQQQYQGPGYTQTQQNQFNMRYPPMGQQSGYQHQHPGSVDSLNPAMAGMSVNQGFNKLWGMDAVDLLKCRDLLPNDKIEAPSIRLQHELYEAANCSPEIFRCTLTKIPETKSLLDKSRLPLGVLIHPFKDLNENYGDSVAANNDGESQQLKIKKQLSVIQCTVIVRCRMCRTYINPFVYFVDNKRWKCNLCFRVNELPDEFQFDPMTKTYGDPSRRPEIKSATIEFIAPSEYMVRPPQPATYVFVLDVCRLACECGYLETVCQTLLSELDNVPGDARTSVAFITFDSAVHFYTLAEGQAQPHQMIVVDVDDMFLPTPENLLVSLNDCRDLIRDLLQELPDKFRESFDTQSALGAALQAAYKLLAPTGGRVTVFQASLPNAGPGALTSREDPSQRAGDNPPHLNPSTDFYKKLALDCSGQQIAVDLFLVNSQYLDLATLSGISRFSGGCIHHVPLFRADKPLLVETLERMFQRYLTRKIGFESVMRLRCTRGLSIHTFHGNFFVRSTDLLSLPNANPDAGFGMQVTIDESLTEVQNVCFQAALLYTSSKGERRIRVHTLCLPVATNLPDILHSADQQCIIGLLAKMAVDRAIQSSLSDAREAFVNVVADILSAYRLTQSGNMTGTLVAPGTLSLLPLYILALLKHVSFRVGQSTRLDDRVFAMCQMKSLPLTFLMQSVYPDLYSLLHIEQQPEVDVGDRTVPQPPRLQLSAERIDSHGLFLMDDGAILLLYIGHNLDPNVCLQVFNVPHFSAIPQELYSLPELDNPVSTALRNFISYLQNEKPYPIPLQVIRDDSHQRAKFIERLIEDKNESGTSYYEFIQRIKTLVK